MLPYLQRSLVLIKPDAVSRGLTGKLIERFETAGLKIIALKMLKCDIEHARNHYPKSEAQLKQMGNKTLSTYKTLGIDIISLFGTEDPYHIGENIHEWNAEFLSSSPIVAIVFEGVHAVKKIRRICGKTMPLEADPGTIRGDFASTSPAVSNLEKAAVYNLVHASDDENDLEEPESEIRHWFSEDEIISDYQRADWQVMYKNVDLKFLDILKKL